MKKILSFILMFTLIFSLTASFAQIQTGNDVEAMQIDDLHLVSHTSYTEDGKVYDEYYYKPNTSRFNIFANILRSERPTEGDFMISIYRGDRIGKAFLDDDIEGYFDALDTEIFFKIAGVGINLASKYPVASFFSNVGYNLLQEGRYADGNSTVSTRVVVKRGKIYHNNEWIEYYHGEQLEYYFTYDMDIKEYPGGPVVRNEHEAYTEVNGYNPVRVEYDNYFRYNDSIYQKSLGAYQNHNYKYVDSGRSQFQKIETTDFEVGVSRSY